MKFNLNLASRHYMNKRAVNQGFLAVVCLLLIFCGWTLNNLAAEYRSLQLERQHQAEVDRQLQNLRGEPKKPLSAKERAALENEFDVVEKLLARDAFRWTSVLDRMEKLLPAGVSLSGFNPDYEKGSLALAGRARNLKQMRVFLGRLLKNTDFKEVYLNSHSRIKVKDYADQEREAIAFSIELEGVF